LARAPLRWPKKLRTGRRGRKKPRDAAIPAVQMGEGSRGKKDNSVAARGGVTYGSKVSMGGGGGKIRKKKGRVGALYHRKSGRHTCLGEKAGTKRRNAKRCLTKRGEG